MTIRVNSAAALAGIAAVSLGYQVAAHAGNVVLKQDFDSMEAPSGPVSGSPSDPGGSWRDFGKGPTSPQLSDLEFFEGEGAATGKSIKITRDNGLLETTDFWLTGAWEVPLESGKIRISFRVFRDSADSGFSVHLGTSEKSLGENTIAVAIGNRSTSVEKVQVMKDDGTWKTTDVPVSVGEWSQVVLDIDFDSSTYLVSLNGEPVGEALPFVKNRALQKISFLPTVPDGNISFIDDVEVVEVD